MRRRARCAGPALLALAALALAAAGCDLVDSLTPFGLGSRGPDESGGTYSGSWKGTTDAEGEVTFTVISSEVNDLLLTHTLSPCGLALEFSFSEPLPIEGGEFSGQISLDPQGQATVNGRFTAAGAASGTYSFSALPTSAQCPSSGRGSFTAELLPPGTPTGDQP